MTATALTDFLLARIADDEAHVNGWCEDYVPCGQREHPGHRSEARTRAECAAKRRIVRDALEAESTWEEWGGEGDGWPEVETLRRIADTLESQLKHLAAVYADHRDYRPEWKP